MIFASPYLIFNKIGIVDHCDKRPQCKVEIPPLPGKIQWRVSCQLNKKKLFLKLFKREREKKKEKELNILLLSMKISYFSIGFSNNSCRINIHHSYTYYLGLLHSYYICNMEK